MADIKFACPHCQQHIQAEPGYVGLQIICPACSGSLIVPAAQVTAVPVQVPVQASAPGPAPAIAQVAAPAYAAPPAAGRPAAPGKRPNFETSWYATPYPYLAVVAVALAVLFYLGRQNHPQMLAFIGTAFLYIFIAHILVVVAAFRKSVGTGFLALFLPFYALYFVFKVSDNNALKVIYSAAVLISISLKFAVR